MSTASSACDLKAKGSNKQIMKPHDKIKALFLKNYITKT